MNFEFMRHTIAFKNVTPTQYITKNNLKIISHQQQHAYLLLCDFSICRNDNNNDFGFSFSFGLDFDLDFSFDFTFKSRHLDDRRDLIK